VLTQMLKSKLSDAVETGVAGAVHLPHPTRTQQQLDFIGSQLCSWPQTHNWLRIITLNISAYL
jgi:hypothetical protein